MSNREQRSHSRIDLRCPVLIDIDGVRSEGYTVNLSETGALTQVLDGELNYYSPGDDGTISIISEYGQTCTLSFVVIRIDAPLLFIHFCDMDPDQCEFVSDLLHLGM